MTFFPESDPLRPAGDVWGVDGVNAARPSQTTVDAPLVDDSSARTSSGFSPELVLLESRILLVSADDVTKGSSQNQAE